MADARELTALIVLLRRAKRASAGIATELERTGSALDLLLRPPPEETPRQPDLFGTAPAAARDGPERELAAAAADLERWAGQGIVARTVLDPDYPANLRTVHDRPPLLFVCGVATAADRVVAVIGSRSASAESLRLAGDITTGLGALNYVVISGLARGVDAAAHRAALDAGARTDAVIGTGLLHAYPPEHRALQAAVAAQGLVFSSLWPEAPPRPEQFPQRNALMSGLARATLIIEAGRRSGTRGQARAALAHGRPVLLHEHALREPWVRDLAARPNVHVVTTANDVAAVLESRASEGLTRSGHGDD